MLLVEPEGPPESNTLIEERQLRTVVATGGYHGEERDRSLYVSVWSMARKSRTYDIDALALDFGQIWKLNIGRQGCPGPCLLEVVDNDVSPDISERCYACPFDDCLPEVLMRIPITSKLGKSTTVIRWRRLDGSNHL